MSEPNDETARSAFPDPATPPLAELGEYIRAQREAARLSLRQLAKRAGVSNPYLSQIERGLRKPSAEILQAVARALEVSSETLYVKAGILEKRDVDDDLESAIARDPHLTDRQRQALSETYRAFRQMEKRDPRTATHRRRSAEPTAASREDPAARTESPVEDGENGGDGGTA